jgi:hypothetical protein
MNNSNETKTDKTDRFKENIKTLNQERCYFWTYFWRYQWNKLEAKSVLILELNKI